mmetsp:Transcript_16271/g.16437  ORF Transcript_16271/g.16437 Transcript_16271/m.16437 type:complete len:290 (-) Transcript_16271:566-1435(-)|eukprot:CAMPEP_0171308438 /NCGR_PEP_ID=MMETSP0816-20121228/18589_1 /TAXON_ID=420281 /ORGANISM="Proboscia inermis, Strain CCAP1064/1" /LENGTH=289 /DNA_ID=CAMNT_0011791349 /DNA_START=56 /DNA_END=925 /DNA_ORIENTATION=+
MTIFLFLNAEKGIFATEEYLSPLFVIITTSTVDYAKKKTTVERTVTDISQQPPIITENSTSVTFGLDDYDGTAPDEVHLHIRTDTQVVRGDVVIMESVVFSHSTASPSIALSTIPTEMPSSRMSIRPSLSPSITPSLNPTNELSLPPSQTFSNTPSSISRIIQEPKVNEMNELIENDNTGVEGSGSNTIRTILACLGGMAAFLILCCCCFFDFSAFRKKYSGESDDDSYGYDEDDNSFEQRENRRSPKILLQALSTGSDDNNITNHEPPDIILHSIDADVETTLGDYEW